MPFIDFAALKERVSMEQAAEMLGLQLTKTGVQFRAPCPRCKTGGDRALVITPEKNLYYCFSEKKGGDVIALTAHIEGIAAKEAAEFLDFHFGTVQDGAVPVTSTSTVSNSRASPAKEPAFDADAYAAKLTYTEQVAALGISQEDAARLSIGYASTGIHRGRIAFPVRNPDGSISGFVSATDLKVPTKWQQPTVVQFQKRA